MRRARDRDPPRLLFFICFPLLSLLCKLELVGMLFIVPEVLTMVLGPFFVLFWGLFPSLWLATAIQDSFSYSNYLTYPFALRTLLGQLRNSNGVWGFLNGHRISVLIFWFWCSYWISLYNYHIKLFRVVRYCKLLLKLVQKTYSSFCTCYFFVSWHCFKNRKKRFLSIKESPYSSFNHFPIMPFLWHVFPYSVNSVQDHILNLVVISHLSPLI